MTSSWLNHYSTQLIGTAFILLGAITAPSSATTLTGFRTEGDMMSGMKVTASFLDGSSQTSIWGSTGDRAGGAFGTGWSLTESRDSYSSPWTLTNLGQGITSLVIQAIPGNTVFDTYPYLQGPLQTDGSAEGWTFEAKLGQSPSSFAYSDEIDISQGDLFGTLSLYWNAGFTGQLVFRADTDSGSSNDPVKPKNPVADNSPPTVDFSLPTIYEGQSASTALYATDAGEDTITFFLNGVSQGTDFNRSGTRTRSANLGYFSDNGTFTYTAQTRDEDGNYSTPVTQTLRVLNVPPSVTNLNIPTIYEGRSAAAYISATDPGADAISFLLNNNYVGTDTSTSGTRAVNTNLGYFADNTYIPYTGYAVDKDGGVSAPVNSGLTVLNVRPRLTRFNLSSNTIYQGQSVSAWLSARDPGADGETFFINGNNVGTNPKTSGTRWLYTNLGTFTDVGTYDFTAISRDKDRAFSNRRTATLTVLNAPPTITSLTKDLMVNVGEMFDFTATATDPGVNDTLTYAWDLNNDGLYDDFTGANGEWSFGDAGTYAIGLQVSDSNGGFTYSQFTVKTVSNQTVPATAVPEPGSALGLLALSAFGVGSLWKRHQKS